MLSNIQMRKTRTGGGGPPPFPGLHFLAPRALNGRHFGEIIGGKFDLASQATQRDRGGKDHRNSGGLYRL